MARGVVQKELQTERLLQPQRRTELNALWLSATGSDGGAVACTPRNVRTPSVRISVVSLLQSRMECRECRTANRNTRVWLAELAGLQITAFAVAEDSAHCVASLYIESRSKGLCRQICPLQKRGGSRSSAVTACSEVAATCSRNDRFPPVPDAGNMKEFV